MPEKLYVCENERCTLGTPGNPGHFTGGISAEQATALTGDPEAPSGDGYCPNCGKKAKAAGNFKPGAGSDPLAAEHEAIAARVADPDDELDAGGAQAAFEELAEKKEA